MNLSGPVTSMGVFGGVLMCTATTVLFGAGFGVPVGVIGGRLAAFESEINGGR